MCPNVSFALPRCCPVWPLVKHMRLHALCLTCALPHMRPAWPRSTNAHGRKCCGAKIHLWGTTLPIHTHRPPRPRPYHLHTTSAPTRVGVAPPRPSLPVSGGINLPQLRPHMWPSALRYEAFYPDCLEELKLLRFGARHDEPTPKARFESPLPPPPSPALAGQLSYEVCFDAAGSFSHRGRLLCSV